MCATHTAHRTSNDIGSQCRFRRAENFSHCFQASFGFEYLPGVSLFAYFA